MGRHIGSLGWAVWLFAASTVWAADAEVHFLDVGVGDAILIIAPEGQRILIDGGDAPVRGEEARPNEALLSYLQRRLPDRALDLVILTHPDADHLSGLVGLFKSANQRGGFRIKEYWDTGYEGDAACGISSLYLRFLKQLSDIRDLTVRRPITKDLPSHATRQLGGLTLRVLLADRAPVGNCATRINDSSLVLKVTHGNTSFLFPGDLTGKARTAPANRPPEYGEGRLLASNASDQGRLRADLLKIPHHGAETSSTEAFIAAVNPRIAVVSADVRFKLPETSVLHRYRQRGIQIYQTNYSESGRDVRQSRAGSQNIVCLSTGNPRELDCAYRQPPVKY